MKTDANIKTHIEKAIQTDTLFAGAGIVAIVNQGQVTLSGHAGKFYLKELARKITKEVEGVTSVTDKIIIVPGQDDETSDSEIKNNIIEAFRKNFSTAYKDIGIVVNDGYVWLEGRLKWHYQKGLAQECISRINGIKGIDNNIFVPLAPEVVIDEKDVLAAIYGNPEIKSDIKVEVMGQRIILKGAVENIDQKNLVTRLVRNVPGVKEIENFLGIRWK